MKKNNLRKIRSIYDLTENELKHFKLQEFKLPFLVEREKKEKQSLKYHSKRRKELGLSEKEYWKKYWNDYNKKNLISELFSYVDSCDEF